MPKKIYKPTAHNDAQKHLIHDLKSLLMEGRVTTQDSLCASLVARGHVVNQSKISRLIHKIDAIKSKNDSGEVVYRLPHEPAPPTPESQLAILVLNVVANETTIIIKTSPGSAQLIARILDYHKERIQILGTIAGDDTIFVAPKSNQLIEQIMNNIKQILF